MAPKPDPVRQKNKKRFIGGSPAGSGCKKGSPLHESLCLPGGAAWRQSDPARMIRTPLKIPGMADEKEYQEYIKNMNERNLPEYIHYHSWVCRSEKNLILTGNNSC